MNKEKISNVTDYKCGYTAILARPNVGKSTLVNYIAGKKIAIAAPVAQTTRKQIKGIYTDAAAQIIFMDTPGIHKPENKFGECLSKQSSQAIKNADVLIFMADASEPSGRGDRWIVENLIKGVKKPVIIAANKIDTMKNPEANICTYKTLFNENHPVVRISALTGKNVPQLIKTIKGFLPYGMPLYPEEIITDQNMRQIASEVIREKIILNTKDEIPHSAAVLVDEYKTEGALDKIKATVFVAAESQKGIIIGKSGAMLKKIGTEARIELERITEGKVFIELFVKVKKTGKRIKMRLRHLVAKSDVQH